MLTSYNINYPLINSRIPGLRDIQIIYWGYKPRPLSNNVNDGWEILPPYVSEVYLSNEGNANTPIIKIVIPFLYKIIGTDNSQTINIEILGQIGTIVDNVKGITTTITADTEELTESITELISENKNTFTAETGAIEPCNVIYAFSCTSELTYKVNDDYEDKDIPVFSTNISCTTSDNIHYILNGEPPYIPEIDPGIKSINGVSGGELELTVSRSLVIENNFSEHTIYVRNK